MKILSRFTSTLDGEATKPQTVSEQRDTGQDATPYYHGWLPNTGDLCVWGRGRVESCELYSDDHSKPLFSKLKELVMSTT